MLDLVCNLGSHFKISINREAILSLDCYGMESH